MILGTLCGLKRIEDIHQWALDDRVGQFLADNFGIHSIPSLRWLRELLSIIDPLSLNEHFIKWISTKLPQNLDDLTIVFDGKTVRSTANMQEHDRPIHILSAFLAEGGLTIGQKTVDKKSNEIPAMRELLQLIKVHGCMVVADALHTQTETAGLIVKSGADYLLNAKGNQETLMNDIESAFQNDDLIDEMEFSSTFEVNGGREEQRHGIVINNVDFMGVHLVRWPNLSSIGAINRRFTGIDGKTSDEWHFYICSRTLAAEELLKFARNEWRIESMHWMLDVHFAEDSCRIRDINAIQNMNMISKIVLNYLRAYKSENGSKKPLSRLMFGCLLDCDKILEIVTW